MSSDPSAIYYDGERIEILISGIIVMVVVILQFLPICILYYLVNEVRTKQASIVCLGVLLIFTLIFSTVLSFFTRAKRHEIYGAAAAYVHTFTNAAFCPRYADTFQATVLFSLCFSVTLDQQHQCRVLNDKETSVSDTVPASLFGKLLQNHSSFLSRRLYRFLVLFEEQT